MRPFKSIRVRILSAVALGLLIGTAAGSIANSRTSKYEQDYAQFSIFAETLSRIEDQYVEETNVETLSADAINGLLTALDPHSHYESPDEFKAQQKRIKREYGGLGIEVTMDDEGVKIGYVNKDGPAYRAGIKSGDHVTYVNGKSVIGKSLDDAVEGMRGLAGDPVEITVQSPGENGRILTVVREVIQGRAVRHRMQDGLGYVFLETFNNQHVTRDMEEAINILKRENNGVLPGLILDLRGNRGGMLDQSVSVSGYFLDGGEVTSVRGREKQDIERYNAKTGDQSGGLKLVVLIDGDSASASEIVAGALQDRGRALIVGTQSFGKGSVQSRYVLSGGQKGALRLTTARYFTPSGRSIQGLGITPDIWVEAFHKKELEHAMRIREASLPNSLDVIIRKTEGIARPKKTPIHEYPPKDFDVRDDYQLKRATEILKSPDFSQKLFELQQ